MRFLDFKKTKLGVVASNTDIILERFIALGVGPLQ